VRPARRSYRLAGALATARFASALTTARRRRAARATHGEALVGHVSHAARLVVRVAYAPAPAEELDLVRVRVRVRVKG
jgi:hypothetical protein